MASPDHAATVRAASSHIARGCRAETSHDPTSYLDQIDAALDALVAALAQAEHERDEARRNERHMRNLHDWRIRDLQDVRADRDFLRERAERAERQRDQAIEALRLLTDWASRMPDAGFTDSDPRWGWWHSPVRAAARDVLAAIEKDAA